MKKAVLITVCVVLLSSCSSVKVLDSWKSDKVTSIKGKKVLVIARTENKQARIAFEQEIAKALEEKGIESNESFKMAPNLNPDEKQTTERKEAIKSMLKAKGYSGIVLSVIKDYSEQTTTTKEGGYHSGAGFPAHYPRYYGGFYGYYTNPYSYATYGNYVPETIYTHTSKTYILETVAYDLDAPENEQLVLVVTSKIVDPENVHRTARNYVKAIVKSIE